MKAIPIVLVILLAALFGWGVYELTQIKSMEIQMGITGLVCALIPLLITVCGKIPEYPRSTIVIRSASIFVCVLLLIINALFAAFANSMIPVFMTDGIIMVIYLIAIYSVAQSKQ